MDPTGTLFPAIPTITTATSPLPMATRFGTLSLPPQQRLSWAVVGNGAAMSLFVAAGRVSFLMHHSHHHLVGGDGGDGGTGGSVGDAWALSRR
jgi:hypothetical protein